MPGPQQTNRQAGVPQPPTSHTRLMTSNYFGLLPPQFVKRKKEFFTYNIRFNTIGASSTATLTANVQNDSDFVWVLAAMTVTDNVFTTFTAATSVPMLLTLSDAASGQLLSDSATHVSNVFGTSQLPFVLPFPKIFRKGGQISATLQNQSATAYVVNLSFHGFKVYYVADDMQ